MDSRTSRNRDNQGPEDTQDFALNAKEFSMSPADFHSRFPFVFALWLKHVQPGEPGTEYAALSAATEALRGMMPPGHGMFYHLDRISEPLARYYRRDPLSRSIFKNPRNPPIHESPGAPEISPAQT